MAVLSLFFCCGTKHHNHAYVCFPKNVRTNEHTSTHLSKLVNVTLLYLCLSAFFIAKKKTKHTQHESHRACASIGKSMPISKAAERYKVEKPYKTNDFNFTPIVPDSKRNRYVTKWDLHISFILSMRMEIVIEQTEKNAKLDCVEGGKRTNELAWKTPSICPMKRTFIISRLLKIREENKKKIYKNKLHFGQRN